MPVPWCQQQRQAWIAETLRVFGFINREHLQRKFGISQPQASKDLADFQRAHSTEMRYDLSTKRYVATWAGREMPTTARPVAAPPQRTAPDGTRILRVAEVMQRVNLRRTTLWKLVRAKQFPAPLRLTGNAIGWRDRDIEHWINAPR
jgi:predicted DNA-binding transcriptional regulator AlpA